MCQDPLPAPTLCWNSNHLLQTTAHILPPAGRLVVKYGVEHQYLTTKWFYCPGLLESANWVQDTLNTTLGWRADPRERVWEMEARIKWPHKLHKVGRTFWGWTACWISVGEVPPDQSNYGVMCNTRSNKSQGTRFPDPGVWLTCHLNCTTCLNLAWPTFPISKRERWITWPLTS